MMQRNLCWKDVKFEASLLSIATWGKEGDSSTNKRGGTLEPMWGAIQLVARARETLMAPKHQRERT